MQVPNLDARFPVLYTLFLAAVTVLPRSQLPDSLLVAFLSCVGCHGHSHHTPAHRSAPPPTERATDKGPSLIFVFSIYSHCLQHTCYVPASWKTSDKCVLTEFIQHLLQREDLLSPCTSTCSEQHKSYLGVLEFPSSLSGLGLHTFTADSCGFDPWSGN